MWPCPIVSRRTRRRCTHISWSMTKSWESSRLCLWRPRERLNAVQLQFNGIPYTAANVEGPGAPGFSAQYTYWGYEHVFYRTTYAGYGKTVADQIATDLTTTSASVSGILLGNMKVHREEDGRTRDGEPIVPGPL